MTISAEKYVATTTYRKSGVAVTTPTWIVPLDCGQVGFLTSSASGGVVIALGDQAQAA
jgi:uncharacterized protein